MRITSYVLVVLSFVSSVKASANEIESQIERIQEISDQLEAGVVAVHEGNQSLDRALIDAVQDLQPTALKFDPAIRDAILKMEDSLKRIRDGYIQKVDISPTKLVAYESQIQLLVTNLQEKQSEYQRSHGNSNYQTFLEHEALKETRSFAIDNNFQRLIEIGKFGDGRTKEFQYDSAELMQSPLRAGLVSLMEVEGCYGDSTGVEWEGEKDYSDRNTGYKINLENPVLWAFLKHGGPRPLKVVCQSKSSKSSIRASLMASSSYNSREHKVQYTSARWSFMFDGGSKFPKKGIWQLIDEAAHSWHKKQK